MKALTSSLIATSSDRGRRRTPIRHRLVPWGAPNLPTDLHLVLYCQKRLARPGVNLPRDVGVRADIQWPAVSVSAFRRTNRRGHCFQACAEWACYSIAAKGVTVDARA